MMSSPEYRFSSEVVLNNNVVWFVMLLTGLGMSILICCTSVVTFFVSVYVTLPLRLTTGWLPQNSCGE